MAKVVLGSLGIALTTNCNRVLPIPVNFSQNITILRRRDIVVVSFVFDLKQNSILNFINEKFEGIQTVEHLLYIKIFSDHLI